MKGVTFIPHHFGICAMLQLHMMHTHTIQMHVHLPPNASLSLCHSAIESAMIILVFTSPNHIVDGQISTTRLANSRNTPFDKQYCMATNHWTSDQKDYNIKNKVLQFQKLDIKNKVHIISNTFCKKTH